MKLTRKLIPAFAMLLVSAVLMSTASFAWFSMNTDVKAEGITVTATAPAALWISTSGQPGTWKTNIDMAAVLGAAAEMNPVTIDYDTIIPTNWDKLQFYTLNSQIPVLDEDGEPVEDENGDPVYESAYGKVVANGSLVDADGNVIELDYPSKSDDTDGYLVFDNTGAEGETVNFFKTYFYLFLEGGDGETMEVNVQAKVTCTTELAEDETVDAIYQAMRIAVVGASSTKAIVFEPSELGTFIPVSTGTGTSTTDNPTLLTITANTATQFAVYVWFEGTDAQCINANSINSQDFAVDFSFN